MANIENNFNSTDIELISPDGNVSGSITNQNGDYVRLSLLVQEAINPGFRNGLGPVLYLDEQGNQKQSIFYSTLNEAPITIQEVGLVSTLNEDININKVNSDFQIFVNNAQNKDNYFVKPNEILSSSNIPDSNYTIQIDFLNQFNPTSIPTDDYGSLPFPQYKEEFDINEDGGVSIVDISQWTLVGRPDIAEYIAVNNLTQNQPPSNTLESLPITDFYNGWSDRFIITEISPSRKEVRLKLKDIKITNRQSNFIDEFKSRFNPFDAPYKYDHILNVGRAKNIPIVNFTIDKRTDGVNNQSIILKLYEPLPSEVQNNYAVTVEREFLLTQKTNIQYFSSVIQPEIYNGLPIDDESNWDDQSGDYDSQFDNYNDLTGSTSEEILNNLITGSSYDYPNLNTNFNFFENHTFFGSAKTKLINFKNKVQTIQSYYSHISSSLYSSGSGINGDSNNLVKLRQNYFELIQKELNKFTPYERFLYYDGQSNSTASAPGVGKNYAPSVPVSEDELTTFYGYDGFDTVYKHSNEETSNAYVDLFTNKYLAHDKPFYGFSGSVYLSFLLKGDDEIEDGDGIIWENRNPNSNTELGVPLPYRAIGQNELLVPSTTGSEYRRFIYKVSQSHWVPTNESNNDGVPVDYDIGNIDNWSATSTQYEILSGSIKTGSNAIIAPGAYQYLSTYTPPSGSTSGIRHTGSIMPSGELFRLFYRSGSGAVTSSFITDVKVSITDPTDTLPFDNLYHTSSLNWENWYDGIYSSASAWDETNIHSLENNLPLFIKESSDYGDFKLFLDMMGEHFDLIRNHIDGMGNLYKRNYNKLDSVPVNLLPALTANFNWPAINPFSGSLGDYFGGNLSSNTNINDIAHNTWRKALNNLIYLYKSKGTVNSVRALLNIYGYPPDMLQMSEFGGSGGVIFDETSPYNQPPIPTSASLGTTLNDTDLANAQGNISYYLKKEKLPSYKFNSDSKRILDFDWYYNNADANVIQLVYKHKKTENVQEILKSSGSGTQTLWDLRLVPSSDGLSSSFEFRLNNTSNGGSSIANNLFSLSSSFNEMADGQLWNVMVQRMTASAVGVGEGTNEYHLYTSLQEGSKISKLNFVTMSISGGFATDPDQRFYSNKNWSSTGSRHQLSSSLVTLGNLVMGRTTSGSIAEFRTWKQPLSASVFRLHTLNKLSTVGNTINSHKDELIYNFKFAEGHTTSSVSSSAQTTLNISDANYKNVRDYSFKISSSLATGSLLFDFDIIDTNNIRLQDLNQDIPDNNKIIINPNKKLKGNLNPFRSSTKNMSSIDEDRATRTTSNKLELFRSPQDFINRYVLDKIQGFNLETLYGNPQDRYSSSYAELEKFRGIFFDHYPIEINTNKFIRTHENLFNHSFIDAVNNVVPARSTFSDRHGSTGVLIKPHILEKPKVDYDRHDVNVHSASSGEINITEKITYITSGSQTTSQKSGIIFDGSTLVTTLDGDINTIKKHVNTISGSSSGEGNGLNLDNSTNESVIEGSFHVNKKDFDSLLRRNTHHLEDIANDSSFEILPFGDLALSSSVVLEGTVVEPSSGTNNYFSTNDMSRNVDLHKNWGTSSSDTHFLNMATETAHTSSDGDYNVNHIERRYHFNMIGDVEIYSGSVGSGSDKGMTDFTNFSKFHNRQIVSDFVHKNITYESFAGPGPGSGKKGIGPQKGRAIGKTRYFYTGSDGTIILPSNHVGRFRDPFVDTMYAGAQNTNPGILPIGGGEDYATSSFYRVRVTGGENQIIIRTPGGPEDDIIINPPPENEPPPMY